MANDTGVQSAARNGVTFTSIAGDGALQDSGLVTANVVSGMTGGINGDTFVVTDSGGWAHTSIDMGAPQLPRES